MRYLVNGKHTMILGDYQTHNWGAGYDLVLVDPPYNLTDLEFDKSVVDWGVVEKFTNMYLISFGGVELLAEIAKIMRTRFTGVWLKPTGTMRTHTAKMPPIQSELYAVYSKRGVPISELVWNKETHAGIPYKKVQRNTGYLRDGINQIDRSNTSAWTVDGYVSENRGTRMYTNVLYGASKPHMKYEERTLHPTQKPLTILETMIKWTTNEGGTVLDCFGGSGSTLVATDNVGRIGTYIEINENYFDMAMERVKKLGWAVEPL